MLRIQIEMSRILIKNVPDPNENVTDPNTNVMDAPHGPGPFCIETYIKIIIGSIWNHL